MKIKFLRLPVLALIMAIVTVGFSSFSYVKKMVNTTRSEVRYWYSDQAATSFFEMEETDIEDATNCSGDGNDCLFGYTEEDLVDPDHPELGLNGTAGSPVILEKS